MKALRPTQRICTWILLAVVSAGFVFEAYNWLSYCSPMSAVAFAFSGTWFRESFHIRNAGLALDQPTIGKFFLGTSVMSSLACTIVLLLRTVVDADRRVARRWVNAGTTILLTLVLIELLAPTFLLIHYVVSMGMTIRRFLGLCLCCGLWILLPSVIFWTWKVTSSVTTRVICPLFWALACSLVAPTYYLSFMLHPSAWRNWDTSHTIIVVAWLVLVVPGLYIMWLMSSARLKPVIHDTKTPNKIEDTGSNEGHDRRSTGNRV